MLSLSVPKLLAIWTGLVAVGTGALLVALLLDYALVDYGPTEVFGAGAEYVFILGFFVWLLGLIVFGILALNSWNPRRKASQTVCTNCGSNRWRWDKATGYVCRDCGITYTTPAASDSQET